MGRPAVGVCGALVALFLVDAALFRTGLYPAMLDPESTAGRVEMMRYVEMRRARSKAAQAIAFGDSRMGFLPGVATAATVGRDVEFTSVAVPGTSPRSWYYQLRDLDPDARRYAAIILPVDDYDDEDRAEDPADSVVDMNYAIARLRLADLIDFTRSFPAWRERWVVLRGLVIKGTVYKDDLQGFLLAPDARRRKVRLFHDDSANWYRNFEADSRDVQGLSVDWSNWTLTPPPGATPAQEKVLRDVLLRRAVPQTGRLAEYRRQWFGRIIDRYRGGATRVFIFRLPRGPVPRPEWLVHRRSSSIREMAARPNVVLLDERCFEPLERPSLFMDPLHMNRKGMDEFSRMLGEAVAGRLSHAF